MNLCSCETVRKEMRGGAERWRERIPCSSFIPMKCSAWEKRRERPYFPSFSHQTCCVSLLSLSITISAGPLKWQEVRETSGEGRQTIKRGLYVEWREKEKSALSHTCPRRDWIYCSPPSFTGCFFDPGSV